MKYRTIKETDIMFTDFRVRTLREGRVFILQDEYFVSEDNEERKVNKNLIIGNPDWEEVIEKVSVELSEDTTATIEQPKRWKMEMVFEATTNQAVELRQLTLHFLSEQMKKLGIKSE